LFESYHDLSYDSWGKGLKYVLEYLWYDCMQTVVNHEIICRFR